MISLPFKAKKVLAATEEKINEVVANDFELCFDKPSKCLLSEIAQLPEMLDGEERCN